MAKVSAIVLAAGLSRRMGSANKMGLLYEEKPLVHHVIDQLSESLAFETIIVTSEVSTELFPNHEFVLNEHYQTGMTSSIQAGVRAASEQSEGYMICLGDQPLISAADYDLLIQNFDEKLESNPHVIVLPTHKGKKGNPVIFSSHYREAILSHQQPEGCKEIVQANKLNVVFQEVHTAAILQDVDRPEDYETLIGNN